MEKIKIKYHNRWWHKFIYPDCWGPDDGDCSPEYIQEHFGASNEDGVVDELMLIYEAIITQEKQYSPYSKYPTVIFTPIISVKSTSENSWTQKLFEVNKKRGFIKIATVWSMNKCLMSAFMEWLFGKSYSIIEQVNAETICNYVWKTVINRPREKGADSVPYEVKED